MVILLKDASELPLEAHTGLRCDLLDRKFSYVLKTVPRLTFSNYAVCLACGAQDHFRIVCPWVDELTRAPSYDLKKGMPHKAKNEVPVPVPTPPPPRMVETSAESSVPKVTKRKRASEAEAEAEAKPQGKARSGKKKKGANDVRK